VAIPPSLIATKELVLDIEEPRYLQKLTVGCFLFVEVKDGNK
jgi:hypothetical protein